jgi:thiamine kinase-like enzyme
VPLLRRVHRDLPRFLRGPTLAFWVFHVLRDYAAGLADARYRLAGKLPSLLARAERLERAVGPIDLVFGHNDLLAANLIDDGDRLWLVDWDYAGWNSPLFDLGGLASNSELPEPDREWLLEAYFERVLSDELRFRAQAMLTASLLREAMWSMVSEIHSNLDFDFVAYTAENLGRFERAWAEFAAMERG